MAIERGKLTVVMGPMFSGKTSRLIEEAKQCTENGAKAVCFKPSFDSRYSTDPVLESHDHSTTRAELFDKNKPEEVHSKIEKGVTVVIIDEVQFCLKTIVGVVEQLLAQGINVVIAGLDYDYQGNKFGPTLELAEKADEIIKLTAKCDNCGGKASKSYAKHPLDQIQTVGAKNIFGAACEECYSKLRGDLNHG